MLCKDLVTLLIQFGADVTIINGEGLVPRQVADAEEVKNLIKGSLLIYYDIWIVVPSLLLQ